MDDTRTRQSLDNLAELYLTGMKPDAQDDPLVGPAPIRLAPKPASAPPTEAPPVPPVSLDVYDHAGANPINDPAPASEPNPILRLTDDKDNASVALEEIEVAHTEAPIAVISPPQAFGKRSAAQGTSASSDRSQPTRDAAPPAQAVAEAVILGNLPGLSGPWLTQYAQLIAQDEGPVAIIHVGDDTIDLELVEPRAQAEPAPSVGPSSVRIPPMNLAAGSSALVELLDALVRNEISPVRTVLIRLDASPEAMAVSRLSALDDWTLLSGSDDASIVAAYRMLKQVIEADPRTADKHVGLMMMGCSESEAEAAVARIASTAQDFLETPAQLVGHLKQMQPVAVRQLGSFPDPTAQWPKLVAFLDQLEAPAPPEQEEVASEIDAVPEAQAPAPTPHVNAVPKAKPPTPPHTPAPSLPTMPALPKVSAPTITSSLLMPPRPRAAVKPSQPKPKPRVQAAPTPEPLETPQPKSQPKRAPKPAATRSATTPHKPAPRPLTRVRELDLVALINEGPTEIAGAVALDARLPNQPTTQLAVDEEGTVHILIQSTPGSASGDGSGDQQQVILDLIAAKQWVSDHLELLALTQRDAVFTDEDPACHLLTDRADLAMGLVNRLGDTLKLHLLQQVTLGKETGWFCTPLN